MTEAIEFFIPGQPVPQGSWVAFTSKTNGRAFAKPSNEAKLNTWRKIVNDAARQAWTEAPYTGPMFVRLRFQFPRLKTKPDLVWVVSRPDKDKLERAVYDGMTGVVYDDDCRVVAGGESKEYADEPGVWVHIEKLGADQEAGTVMQQGTLI